MWFTELNGNKIGRISLDGQITEIPVPSAGAQPRGIALGPNGDVWFTESGSNKIARISLNPTAAPSRPPACPRHATVAPAETRHGAVTSPRCPE